MEAHGNLFPTVFSDLKNESKLRQIWENPENQNFFRKWISYFVLKLASRMRYFWDRKCSVFTRNSARSSLIADLEAKQPGKMILSFWHSMPLLGSRYILFINSWAAVCLSVNKENNGWSVVIVWNIHRISLFNLPIALRSITPIQLFWGPNLNRSIFRNQNKISVFSKVNKVRWGRLEFWFLKGMFWGWNIEFFS